MEILYQNRFIFQNYQNSHRFHSSPQALQALGLETNKIGDSGAQQLAEALKVNTVSCRF